MGVPRVYISKAFISSPGYEVQDNVRRLWSVQFEGIEHSSSGSIELVKRCIIDSYVQGNREFIGRPDPGRENPEIISRKGDRIRMIERYDLMEPDRLHIESLVGEDARGIRISMRYPGFL